MSQPAPMPHSSKSSSQGKGKKPKSSTMLILSLVMIVNALAYGIIIPLLYPYAERFGFNAFTLSLLFTSFSIMQFISTPILGRLSDKFGRKPVLLFCLLGTAISLGMFAAATSALMLFIARMIDGVTGGNIAVAQAMISDSTEGQERAKAFGMLGAAFGIGFLLGPALGGLMSSISIQAPFWFAAALALFGTIAGAIFLPETLKPTLEKKAQKEPLFRLNTLYQALFKPATGVILLVSFLAAIAMNVMILGFQTFTVDVLELSSTQIGLFFSSFGLIGVIMQMFVMGPVLKRFKSKKNILLFSLMGCGVAMALAFFTRSLWPFWVVMSFFGIAGAFRDPLLTSMLSERTKAEDQGGIMGINQAYVSLGQIVGPLLAGLIASYSVPSVFLLAAGLLFVSTAAARRLSPHPKPLNL